MKALIEGGIYCILFVFLCYTAMEVVVANRQLSKADAYVTYLEEKAEQSNTEELILDAKKNGYEVTLNERSTPGGMKQYYINLTYEIRLPLLGVLKTNQITGYSERFL